VKDKTKAFEESNYLEKKIREVLQGKETDAILTKHLEAMFLRPEGMMLMMAGFTADSIKPMIQPFIFTMDKEIAGMPFWFFLRAQCWHHRELDASCAAR
jgi:hypothetical protein